MNIFDFIGILGLMQGLLVSIFILRNKIFSNSLNRYFALFLLILTIIGFDSLLSPYYHQLDGYWYVFFDIVGDDIPWIMMFYLPLFTFFLLATDTHIKIPIGVLYIPFWIFLAINVLIDLDMEFHLISVPFLMKNRLFFYQMEDYIAITMFLTLHTFIFFYALKRSSNKWLTHLWWYCSVIIAVWLYFIIDYTFGGEKLSIILLSLLWTSVSVFIYWFIYTGLFQFNLANNRQSLKEKFEQASKSVPSQELKPKISSTYFDQLMDLITHQAIYRNPDLSREDVAEKLGISSGYLTQLIKEQKDMSFTAFINHYRLVEVGKMLLDTSFDHFDVLSIGLEAGFKSKSAFFASFKKFYGMTPNQFRKEKS